MDMMAMVSSMLAMKAAGTQGQIAASFIKQNADAEKSAVLTLLGAGQGSAILGADAGDAKRRTSDVQSNIGESRPSISRFRIRSFHERPGMTVV